MPKGQCLMFSRLLKCLGDRGTLVLCEHPLLHSETVEPNGGIRVPPDILRFQVRWFESAWKVSQWFPGARLTDFIHKWVAFADARDTSGIAKWRAEIVEQR